MPSLTLVNPRGTTQTANQLAEYEHWVRRGYTPQDGSTTAAGRQLFTGQPDVPDPLEPTAATRLPNTAVILGDSITAAALINAGSSLYYGGRGFWTWASVRLRHRLRLLNNAGVSGETLQQIQARIPTDVLPYRPGWVHVLGGTNNITTTDTATDIQNVLTSIWNTLSNAGCRVVAGTLTPRTGLTTAQQTKLVAVNEWIRQQARTRPGLVVVDYFAALVNPATVCDYATGYSYDGTHPTTPGAARMGRQLADALDPLIPRADPLPGSSGAPGMLSANPYQNGTAGSLANAATGTVADSWTASPVSGSGGVAASKVARGDLIAGAWTQLVCSNATTGARLYATNTGVGTAWAVGDQVYGWAEFETDPDWATPTQFRLTLNCLNTSFAAVMAAHDLNWQAGDTYDAASMRIPSGILRTPAITIPTGTNLRLQLEAIYQGTGTFRVGRAGFAKVV